MPQRVHYYREEEGKIIRIPCITPQDIRELGEEDTETLLLVLAVQLLDMDWNREAVRSYLNKNMRILLTLDTIERSASKEKIIEELNDEELELDIVNKADFVLNQAERLRNRANGMLKALKEANLAEAVFPQ